MKKITKEDRRLIDLCKETPEQRKRRVQAGGAWVTKKVPLNHKGQNRPRVKKVHLDAWD